MAIWTSAVSRSGKNVYHRASSTFYTGPGAGGDGVNGVTTLGTFRLAANTTATFNSRNGYGMTLGAWTQESSNNNSTITNNMGGTLTFTGNAWNNNDAAARTLTIGGNGNTIITAASTRAALRKQPHQDGFWQSSPSRVAHWDEHPVAAV